MYMWHHSMKHWIWGSNNMQWQHQIPYEWRFEWEHHPYIRDFPLPNCQRQERGFHRHPCRAGGFSEAQEIFSQNYSIWQWKKFPKTWRVFHPFPKSLVDSRKLIFPNTFSTSANFHPGLNQVVFGEASKGNSVPVHVVKHWESPCGVIPCPNTTGWEILMDFAKRQAPSRLLRT